MKSLVIIPARGGSKGIPDKNIRPLCGVPLIAHTIRVAREVADDADICVSTDSPAIARVAEAEGLAVPFLRPDYLATDTAGSREVMLHALDFYAARGVDYDSIVLLQPTSPLRNADDVRGCMERYTPDLDMVVSVKEAASNPYYNCYETDAYGMLCISKGDGLYTRRQDAPQAWEYNGAVYVINAASLRTMPMGKFSKRVPYVMPANRSVDIDSPIDLVVAEAIMNESTAKHGDR